MCGLAGEHKEAGMGVWRGRGNQQRAPARAKSLGQRQKQGEQKRGAHRAYRDAVDGSNAGRGAATGKIGDARLGELGGGAEDVRA